MLPRSKHAIYFNGVDDKAVVSLPGTLYGVSAWVKFEPNSKTGYVFRWKSGSNFTALMLRSDNTTTRFYYRGTQVNLTDFSYDGSWQWFFMGRNQATGNLLIYRNHVKIVDQPQTGQWNGPFDIQFGNYDDANFGQFGLFDFRADTSNLIRSDAQVQRIYEDSPFAPSAACNLLCNEESGATLYDRSGNSNDAAITTGDIGAMRIQDDTLPPENPANSRGYTDNAGVIIPRDESTQPLPDDFDNFTLSVDINKTAVGYTADIDPNIIPTTDETWWVDDETGSDSNDGSEVSPFQTIDKALQSVVGVPLINVGSGDYSVTETWPSEFRLVGIGSPRISDTQNFSDSVFEIIDFSFLRSITSSITSTAILRFCNGTTSASEDSVALNGEVYLEECKAIGNGAIGHDGFNYGTGQAIEINCEAYGWTELASSNASTQHNDTRVVRVNSNMHSSNRVVHNIHTSKSVNLGGHFHDSTGAESEFNNFGFGASADPDVNEHWLYGVQFSGNFQDIYGEANQTIWVDGETSYSTVSANANIAVAPELKPKDVLGDPVEVWGPAATADLNKIAQLTHGKSGEIPCKYPTLVSTQLNTKLLAHTPQTDLVSLGENVWKLTQQGAKAVHRELVALRNSQ